MMKYLRIAIISLIVILLATFFILTIGNDPQEILLSFLKGWNISSIWLVLLIFGLTLISTLTGLPVNYLGVAIGFFLPLISALPFAFGINLISVMLSFFMIRGVFSSYFTEKYGDKSIIKSINKRIKKYKFWTVAFSRAIYIIPTNIINFTFPLSKITSRTYFLGTVLGLIPECIVNVAIGYLLKHQVLLLDDPKNNVIKIIIIGLALVFIGVVYFFILYRKKRRDRIKEIIPLLKDDD